jgi:hypothetical protein
MNIIQGFQHLVTSNLLNRVLWLLDCAFSLDYQNGLTFPMNAIAASIKYKSTD